MGQINKENNITPTLKQIRESYLYMNSEVYVNYTQTASLCCNAKRSGVVRSYMSECCNKQLLCAGVYIAASWCSGEV